MRLLPKFSGFEIKYGARYKWIDFLRGIAIILVVYRHVLNGLQNSGADIPKYLETANLIFYSFRMPLFFILSGIFYRILINKKNISGYIESKFNTLLYPYFIWSFVQITIQILLSPYTNSKRQIVDYLYILYQPRELDQFWYLPALFNVSIIYILTDRLFKQNNILNFVFGLILFTIAPYFNKISIISDWMEYFLFFAIGDILSKHFINGKIHSITKPKWIIPIIVIFLLSQTYYVYNSVTRAEFLAISLIGCLFMIQISILLEKHFTLEWLRIIGLHSLQIYVMHVIFAGLSRTIFMKLLNIHEPHLLLFVGITVSSIFPIVTYNSRIFQQTLWFLFSPKRPTNTASVKNN